MSNPGNYDKYYLDKVRENYKKEQSRSGQSPSGTNSSSSSGSSSYSRSYSSGAPPLTRRDYLIALAVVLVIAGFLAFKFTTFFEEAYSGVIGLFGSEASSESAAMNVIRKAKSTDMVWGEQITGSELTENRAAVTAFMNSGADYRVKGRAEYGYYSSPLNGYFKFVADVEMSYNSETDVYKFKLSNVALYDNGDKLNNRFNDIKEGVYYIVKENGTTYLLSEINGVKKVTEASENRAIYDFLMGLRMESAISLNFFTDDKTKCGKDGDGAYYLTGRDSTLNMWFSHKGGEELKTYKNKPVYYYACHIDNNLGLDRMFEYNFYYDKIPNDNPSVADWK